ncbi:MAG: GntR family transcriptional regulator [Tepidisphaerales bacterium]
MALELSIVTGSAVPIYRQIIDQICQAMARGELPAGEQMPSVRALAERLLVNPNTIARTYADLVRDGILETQRGRGVFVAQRRPVYTKAERMRRIEGALNTFVSQAVHLGFSPEEIRQVVQGKLDGLAGTLVEEGRHE